MGGKEFHVAALVAASIAIAAARPASSATFDEMPLPARAALYAGSALLTPPYAAMRAGVLVGATGLAGGVALISLGADRETPNRIIEAVSSGEWWVEPRHFTGEKRLRLPGR